MTDLIQLTDAEIAGVSGGILNQSISISADQSNSASVSQSATATNTGAVTASAASVTGSSLAAAAGAEADNTSLVSQRNSITASNRQSFHIRF
jgi:hypothetical protein